MMRIVFVLIVLLNVALYAVGQGWWGPPPVEAGRGPVVQPEVMPDRMLPVRP